MPTKPKPQFTSWSFSRWWDYSECPARARWSHIDKLKREEKGGNKAMERGEDIHKLAEKFALRKLITLPPELQNFKTEFKALAKENVRVEQEWAFTLNWKSMVSWFSKEAWVRVKMDAAYQQKKDPTHFVQIDHKTGREKPYHRLQNSLYAVAGFMNEELAHVKTITAKLWYLDLGEERVDVYTRKDLPRIKTEWDKRIAPMFADRNFAMRPSEEACKWCKFKKDRGGPCKF